MHDILTLLKPRIWPITNRKARKHNGSGLVKNCLLGAIGLSFWGIIFTVSIRVLSYFKGIDEIGNVLGYKLLSMILVVSFALLIFSSILTSLSKLFLSRDLMLVHSLPISSYKIFVARWIDSAVESAWMVIIFTLPIFLSYGIVFRAGAIFYISIPLTMIPLVVAASAISTVLVMAAVMVIPANRLKSIFILLGILFFVVLYLAIRLSRPELLVDPEVFDSAMVYMTTLQTPLSPLLPSTWAYDGLLAALSGQFGGVLFNTAIAWCFAGTMLFVMTIVADAIYFRGFSKTQASPGRLIRGIGSDWPCFDFLPGPIKSFTVKEIKTFLRDQTQWSQLFLIGALIVIYVYNFKVLPIEKSPINTIYLQNLFSFLNMGLALFVLTAVSARFAYPAVSQEREAFWLVKSSPLSLRVFLWIKFSIYYFPLLILTEILIVTTNILLDVTPFMMALSTITVFLLVPGIVAMAIGFGAAYPDFKAENATQTVTSFGGLMFMIVCAGFISTIVLLEAGPVYNLFIADMRGNIISLGTWFWIYGSFGAVLVISLLAIFLPMRFGVYRLSKLRI